MRTSALNPYLIGISDRNSTPPAMATSAIPDWMAPMDVVMAWEIINYFRAKIVLGNLIIPGLQRCTPL